MQIVVKPTGFSPLNGIYKKDGINRWHKLDGSYSEIWYSLNNENRHFEWYLGGELDSSSLILLLGYVHKTDFPEISGPWNAFKWMDYSDGYGKFVDDLVVDAQCIGNKYQCDEYFDTIVPNNNF